MAPTQKQVKGGPEKNLTVKDKVLLRTLIEEGRPIDEVEKALKPCKGFSKGT